MDELFNDFEKLSSNDFYKNPIYSLMKRIDVNGKEMATFIKYLNDYDVIKYHRIYSDRLKEVLYMCDIEFDSNLFHKLHPYTIIE